MIGRAAKPPRRTASIATRALAVCGLAMSLAACAGILGLRSADPHQRFPHRAHVLEGIECQDCHQGIAQAGSDGPLHIPDTEACLECHDPPHDRRDCAGCHGLPYVREAAATARHYLRFAHDRHLERGDTSCVRCHANIRHDGVELRPGMSTCFGCHAHRDQFEVRMCDGCHVNLRAEHTRPRSHLVHDGDFVREHGTRAAAAPDLCASCHAETYCASCHGQSTAALPERLGFDDPLRAGFHRAGFRSRHGEAARGQPGLCTTCHTNDSCQSCHDASGIGAPRPGLGSPHERGWVGSRGTANRHGPAARRNPAECAGCHSGAGEALCVGCHRVGGVGGNPHPAGWSSRLDKYRDLPCRRCHSLWGQDLPP